MYTQRLCILLYFLILYSQIGYSQLTVTSGASSSDIQVCIDTQTVDITLSANSTITGDSITILLPPGVSYAANSLSFVSNPAGISITESTITNPQQPTFNFSGTMNIGDVCVFRIGRFANCQTIAYRDLGNLLLDSVFVTYNNPTSTTANNLANTNISVIPFGLNEALVSLGSIANIQGHPGDISTRDISITNGGLGCVQTIEFYTVDAAVGIQINQLAVTGITGTAGSSPPTLPIVLTPHTINGDTSFYTLDVEALHGTGAVLCNGQTITIEETIEIISCFSNSGDGETRYGVYWECLAQCQPINTTTANVSIPPGVPNLSFSNESTLDRPDCFEGQTFTKRFRITNNGTVNAVNVNFAIEVRARSGSATILLPNTSFISTSSGSGPTSITASPFEPKKATYTIDSIPPGAYVELEIDVEHPCPTSCGRYLYDGYRLEDIAYEDPCGVNYSTPDASFTTNREFNAINPLESNFPAIANGQTRTFTSSIASIRGLSNTSIMFWEVILPPCGVVFNNNPGDIDWGGTAPTNISISGDTVRAEFAVANSNAYNNAPFNIVLSGVCGSCGTNQNISKRLLINPCPSNSNHCQVCIYEVTEGLVVEQCSVGGSCTGAAVNGFQFVRTNLGLPDNNNDRLADGSGSLNLSLIDRSRFIVSDTAQAVIQATIFINSGSPVLDQAYGEFTIDDHWDFIDASIEVFDASTGTTFTCTGASATSSASASKRTYTVDVSPNTLGATCPSMSGFAFENGDSVTIRANLVNTLNGTNIFSGIVYPIDFYVAEVPSPSGAQRLSCGSNAYSEIYSIYNINPGLDIAGIGSFSSCGARQIDLEFESKTGDNIQNFNIFPYEWRPIAFPDTVKMVMPTGYTYVSARLSSFIGVPNNIAIEPLNPNADTLVFAVGQIYQPGGIPSNPVQESIPDGIERSEVQVFIQATCETPANTNEPITMILDAFHPLPQLQALELLDGERTENNLSWNKPDIAITNVSSQTAEGTTNTLEWTVRVNNITNNSDAANIFLNANVPSGNVTITNIEHIATNGNPTGPTSLTKVNNIWQFGDIDRIHFHDFRITATYTQCMPDTLLILAGFDCSAYPASLSAYTSSNACELDSLLLYTDPKTATLQLNPIATGVTDDICDTLVYAFTLNSADLANVLDPSLRVTLPQGILLLGNPTIEYPLGTAPRPFTITPTGQTLMVDIAAADAQNPGTHSIATNGILGTREASNANERQVTISFRFRTDCNFQSGSSFYLQPNGFAPCGSQAGGSNITSFEPPILIAGLVPPYNVSTKILLIGSTTCADTVQNVLVEMIPDGPSTGRDTGFFDLPEHVAYAGNFTCSEANPAICPTFVGLTNNLNGTSSVMVQYPSTWSLGDTINFSFDINTAGFSGCSASELITVKHTVTMAGPTCDANGLPCGDVKVITGQANLAFAVQKPDFAISNLTALTNAVSSGQSYTLSFDITNNGLDAPAGMIAEFYCADASGNPTGLPIHTHNIAIPIASNQTISENVFFTTPTSCNNLQGIVILIAQSPVSSNKQCICQDEQSLITDIPTDLDLPIDWLFFNAEKVSNNATTLTWGTASEINSLGFEIEHAQPTTGLPQFEMIDFIESKGNPLTGANYSYDITNMLPGVHYFRLRQVDIDGSYEYSEIKAILITGPTPKFKVYPTLIQPNNQVLYLFSPKEDRVVVELYSIIGQESAILYTGDVKENSLIEIPLNEYQFPVGHYIIRVRTHQEAFTQKVTIIR
ncbi:hypothetical protein [Aureispira anguillae]|uniref:Secretion system C-terminal sorting domain-containing protein n=1 Tax=Aureispira anguillae TaxID=2864201 RepID=A0A915YJV6_9BACT|nr:hypothetical protein [Aureispira anguillae]BDS14438.1 hypothetical protein AsAng_0052180 [Aureispira anguillae]